MQQRRLWPILVFFVFVLLMMGLVSCGDSQQQASTPQVTPQPTVQPTRSQIDDTLSSVEPNATIVSYNQKSAALVLQESFGYAVALTQDETKLTLQGVQLALWRQGWYFSQVTFNILQAQDNGAYKKIAFGVITWKTADKINWTIPPDLWDVYDQKYLDPSLPNF